MRYIARPTDRSTFAGDTEVKITQAHMDARIRVFADGTEIGDGTGAVIRLSRPIAAGETIAVTSQIGECLSPFSNSYMVGCGPLRPASLSERRSIFNVSESSYSFGTIELGGRTVRIEGQLYVPEDPLMDAHVTPPRPLVLIMHGAGPTFFWDGNVESDPECNGFRPTDRTCCAAVPVPASETEIQSYLGYEDLAYLLASRGALVASINANDLNCSPEGRLLPRRCGVISNARSGARGVGRKLSDANRTLTWCRSSDSGSSASCSRWHCNLVGRQHRWTMERTALFDD